MGGSNHFVVLRNPTSEINQSSFNFSETQVRHSRAIFCVPQFIHTGRIISTFWLCVFRNQIPLDRITDFLNRYYLLSRMPDMATIRGYADRIYVLGYCSYRRQLGRKQ
jgi:hypothetical protein